MTTMVQHAVIEHKGIWPAPSNSDGFRYGHLGVMIWRSEFEAEAKRMGFINGYRYGVEYPTNGKKPDLDDDVVVCIDGGCSASSGDSVDGWNWNKIKSFRITDQRYKPADTSYLNALSQDQSLTHSEEGLTHSDWYCYETQKALRLPPAGAEFEGFWPTDDEPEWAKGVVAYASKEHFILKFEDGKENYYHATDFEKRKARFRPLDHATRKAELEKSRVVSEAQKVCVHFASKDLGALYDAGYLRLPDKK